MTEAVDVVPRVTHLAIDCDDLDGMARFWGALLGMKVTERDEVWLELERLGEGGPVLSFQRVPEGKQVKNRLHLDLTVPDLDAAGVHARALGARPVSALMGSDPEAPFQVWQDPEGNEFCFVTGG
ncbi:VOC family protein [Spirillospora sp. NPDC047279]|uniref:VOC family protein n=1 Tax=Spirillospora sp. NPDC047279 TaxID=3155478 RepID=UPI00340E689B